MNSNKFINNFRTWLNQQSEKSIDELIGAEVFPTITTKNFCETVDVVKGNMILVAKCFKNEGGVVESICDNQALVNCRKGTFYIDTRDIKKS